MKKNIELNIALAFQKKDLLIQTINKIINQDINSCQRELKRIKELQLDQQLIDEIYKINIKKAMQLQIYLEKI